MQQDFFKAQFGEDRELVKMFPADYKGTCVEVGAYDGVTGSNTYYFEKIGWNCLLLEPLPGLAKAAQANRTSKCLNLAASDRNGTAKIVLAKNAETLSSINPTEAHLKRIHAESGGTEEIEIHCRLLTEILTENQINKIDFITIDVEGHELEVLRGFDLERFKPRVMIIEDNSAGSESSVHKYLEPFGYVCFKRTGCNDWFAQKTDRFANPEEVDTLTRWRASQHRWEALKKVPLGRSLFRLFPLGLRNRIKGFLKRS